MVTKKIILSALFAGGLFGAFQAQAMEASTYPFLASLAAEVEGQLGEPTGPACAAEPRRDTSSRRTLRRGGPGGGLQGNPLKVSLDAGEAGSGEEPSREAIREAVRANCDLLEAEEEKVRGAQNGDNGSQITPLSRLKSRRKAARPEAQAGRTRSYSDSEAADVVRLEEAALQPRLLLRSSSLGDISDPPTARCCSRSDSHQGAAFAGDGSDEAGTTAALESLRESLADKEAKLVACNAASQVLELKEGRSSKPEIREIFQIEERAKKLQAEIDGLHGQISLARRELGVSQCAGGALEEEGESALARVEGSRSFDPQAPLLNPKHWSSTNAYWTRAALEVGAKMFSTLGEGLQGMFGPPIGDSAEQISEESIQRARQSLNSALQNLHEDRISSAGNTELLSELGKQVWRCADQMRAARVGLLKKELATHRENLKKCERQFESAENAFKAWFDAAVAAHETGISEQKIEKRKAVKEWARAVEKEEKQIAALLEKLLSADVQV